ncbi:flagellar biosynthesis protein FliR [Bacillus sp. JCM 19047]|nr:flagellar biosynthesis protein FliR [Bacillus sp. JCM 19047]
MDVFIQLYPTFLLVFVRIASFFLVLPLYNYRTIPLPFKVGIASIVALLLVMSVDFPTVSIDATYAILLIKEALVGLLTGLVAMMLLYAVQIAGGLIDFHMGFMLANVVDPQTGAQSPLTGSYLYVFALLYLLIIDGHHLLLDGAVYSFEFVPIDQLFLPLAQGTIVEQVAMLMGFLFAFGVSMAFPVVGSLFLVDIALGIVSRTVPQMNVFVVGMPIKLMAGLIILFIYIGVFFMSMNYLFKEMILAMRELLEGFGGSG